MTKVFHFAWQTKTGNRMWKVCITQGLTKSAGREIRHNFNSWVDWDAGWVIRSQFSFRLNCYEILWLYIDKSRLQSFRRTFTVIIRTLYHGNWVCPYRIWLVMTASVYVKNWNLDPRNKLHAIPRFTAGIICGPHRDHLWFGIICGRGTFAVLYTTRRLSGPFFQSSTLTESLEMATKQRKTSQVFTLR